MYYNKLRNLVNPQKIRRVIYNSSMNVGTLGAVIGGVSVGLHTGTEAMNLPSIRRSLPGSVDEIFGLSFVLIMATVGFAGGAVLGGICGVVWPVSLLGMYAMTTKKTKRNHRYNKETA